MTAIQLTFATAIRPLAEAYEIDYNDHTSHRQGTTLLGTWTVATAKRVGNLAEFLADSPLRGSGVNVRRMTDQPPAVEL